MLFIYCLNISQRKKIFRCILCGEFSFKLICNRCQELLTPSFYKKDDVISFYKYEEIEFLIKYKYHKFGNFIFNYLALPFKKFSENFPYKLNIIPIEDNKDRPFSHTAILAKGMRGNKLYSSLIATNRVSYAGKSLDFRLNNPRGFKYYGPKNIDVVLVDDIVTTKTTLNEAKEVLKKSNVNVLFSLVLADLR